MNVFTRHLAGGLLFLGALMSPARGQTPSLLAGTAKADITPDAGAAVVNLSNLPLRPRDPIFARVLVLKTPDVSLAIVTVDLIVFASAKVVAEAKAKWGVDHVILCATHTHAAPSPRGLVIHPPAQPDWTRGARDPGELIDWPGLSADPWYAATEAKIIEAIGRAVNSAFPARLVAGKGPYESPYMAHNRRLVTAKGVTMLWENPERRPTRPLDPTVGVIRVEDLAGKPRAFAVHYACHPVALMTAGVVSPDFPGATVDYLESELGPDCLALFLQGASGDLDPFDLHSLRGENRFNIVKQAGQSLAKGALRVSAGLKTPAATPMQVKESLLAIPNRHGGQITEVGVLTAKIGRDLALVAIPGEPFVQHQLDLSARSPVAHSFILGLAYHGRGTPFTVYIPTARAVEEGGYGATECSFLAPSAGEKMVSEGIARLGEMAHSE
jgi:neutral ceramidase